LPRSALLPALLLVGTSLAGTSLGRAQVQEGKVLDPPPPVPASPAPGLAPAAPASAPSPMPAPLADESPRPPRPTVVEANGAGMPLSQPRRFDQSLDELVRDGVVTPAERDRVQAAGAIRPGANLPGHRQACSSGALSEQECRTGVSVRWRGRIPGLAADAEAGELAMAAGLGRLGSDGMPLPPITVPVSALLSGSGGSFRLTDVFRVTPRPAPLLGNGNRGLLYPLIGSAVTTSGFGWRLHPVLGSWLMHAGKDLAAPEGTPVVAALSGKVVSSGLAGGYGLAVEIEHQRPLRRTLYGHLSELYVQEGEMVSQGTVIGRVGSTGLSTGPHLHFELRLPENGGWVAVDPGQFDPGRQGIGGPDAIALLMGQLLQSLERPGSNPNAG
jgi:murein DD-endopeptidase MepM/ murein hydrolase activator NlpD